MLDGTALCGIAIPHPAKLLAALLEDSPDPLTHVLGRIAGCRLALRVVIGGERHLTAKEQYRLDAPPVTVARWRHGHLLTPSGLLAASVALIWLPSRLDDVTNAAMDKGGEPAGVILGRLGMRREDRRAMATAGMEGVLGPDVAVRSSAVLVIAGVRVGIASELVTRDFTDLLAAP